MTAQDNSRRISKRSVIRELFALLLIMIMVSAAILGIINAALFANERKLVDESVKRTYEAYCEETDINMANMKHIADTLPTDKEIKNWIALKEDYFVNQRVKEHFYNLLSTSDIFSGMWITSFIQDRSLWVRGVLYEDVNRKLALEDYFDRCADYSVFRSGVWQTMTIDNEIYILYLNYSEQYCVGVWTTADSLSRNLWSRIPEETVRLQFSCDSGSGPVYERTYEEPGSRGNTVFHRLGLPEFKQIGCELKELSGAGFEVTYPYLQQWRPRTVLLLALSFSAGFILLMLFLGVVLRKELIRPIRGIIDSIQEIKNGNLDTVAVVDDYPVEFQDIGNSLNDMTKSVSSLKIAVYEEQIKKKEAEMQFYYSQIKPHFLLNIINAIYSMASIGENDTILKTCRYMSDYMRYRFSRKEMQCTLDQEIEHLKEYILLQQVRYPDALTCSLEMVPAIMGTYIPTLSIHSLVENVFKYGISDDGTIYIEISGHFAPDDPSIVVLRVQDHGPGFEKTEPEWMNRTAETGLTKRDEHETRSVGLQNTAARFREMYPESFEMHLLNMDGAVVEIRFCPEEWQKADQEASETGGSE